MFDLAAAVRGCTFDDFLFAPRFSVLERRDPRTVDLSARFSEHLTLKVPVVSANMDTITRSAMAVVLAEEGGLGVIDRGFRGGDIAAQVREVEIVKRTQHGVIPDPYTVAPDDSLATASRTMQKSGVGTLVVVDGARKLKGLLTARDVRFVAGQKRVSERMTPLEGLVVHTGAISLDEAEQVMIDRKIKKLPLVDGNGVLTGLITAKDIIEQKRLPLATRDAQGRLRVGAAIGAKGDYLERAAELIKAGVDVLVIDIAARSFDRDGEGARGLSRAVRRLRARRRECGDRRRREIPGRAGRKRHQGRHRPGRRLHHTAQHQLRRAAIAGAR